MTITKDVWQNRDNQFALMLDSTDPDGVRAPLDTSLVTKVMLEFEGAGSLSVLFQAPDALINWWDETLAEGEIRFELGDFAAAIPPGAYAMRLTVYSLATPDGIVWASYARQELRISVHSTDAVAPANVTPISWAR